MKKVKVELDKDLVNELIKLKEVGLTYSDVIRKLLKHYYTTPCIENQ